MPAMRRNPMFRKLIALVLLSVTLTLAMNRFTLKIEFFEELQDCVSQKAFISADDEGSEQGLNDLKKPKYSVYDHVSSCGDLHPFPAYNPKVAHLTFEEPSKAVPEVYLDIFVPPDNLELKSVS